MTNRPPQRIEQDGKKWQLIFGPLDNKKESDRAKADFDASGIAWIEHVAPNGKKYLYRDDKGYVEITHVERKAFQETFSKQRMQSTRPKKSALRKMIDEVGDIKRSVQVALLHTNLIQ